MKEILVNTFVWFTRAESDHGTITYPQPRTVWRSESLLRNKIYIWSCDGHETLLVVILMKYQRFVSFIHIHNFMLIYLLPIYISSDILHILLIKRTWA